MRETSIEEVIAERMNDRVNATEMKFLASGREDVDVRMLGSGRPFAFECVNPRKTKFTAEELLELENHINCRHAGVHVNSLEVVTKEDIKTLKEGEEDKKKVLDDTMAFLRSIATSCDYMAVNFELRKANREAEIDGLIEAGASLEGGAFAKDAGFLQRGDNDDDC